MQLLHSFPAGIGVDSPHRIIMLLLVLHRSNRGPNVEPWFQTWTARLPDVKPPCLFTPSPLNPDRA